MLGRHRQSGLTLMELVVSLALVSLIVGALGAAMIAASHALPDGKRTTDILGQATGVLQRLDDELRTSIYITERAASAVTFVIADRSGDGLPETLRYTWGGNDGDPLMRKYNDEPEIPVVDGVTRFVLSYETNTVVERYPGPHVESAEQEFSSCIDQVYSEGVRANGWLAQHFKPLLPAEAISWRMTRAYIKARQDGEYGGSTLVQIRGINPDLTPSSTVLQQQPMSETDLTSSSTWQEFSFSHIQNRIPGESLCLVLQHDNGDVAAKVGVGNASDGKLSTVDSGANWDHHSGEALVHYIYGTYFVFGQDQVVTRNYISSVQSKLEMSLGGFEHQLVNVVQTLNLPEVLTAVWDAEFTGAPTQLDLNCNGIADWELAQGVFELSDLVNGVWYMPGNRLRTITEQDFSEVTTVNIRCRDTVANGNPVRFRIYGDRVGDSCAIITALVQLQEDGTQTVKLKHHVAPMTGEILARFDGLEDQFVNMRLIFDPGHDTVAIFIDGKHHGTYRYDMVHHSSSSHAWINAPAADGEVDVFRIRVGGAGS